jgi:hypothetical protein
MNTGALGLKDVGLSELYELPNVFKQLGIEGQNLAYQGQFLGLPFHHHQSVFNEVIRGKKLWMFYPPNVSSVVKERIGQAEKADHYMEDQGLYYQAIKACHTSACTKACQRQGPGNARRCTKLTDHPKLKLPLAWAQRWLGDLPREERPQLCLSTPGTMVAVPNEWYHSTINLEDTILVVSGSPETPKMPRGNQPANGNRISHDALKRESDISVWGDGQPKAVQRPGFSRFFKLGPDGKPPKPDGNPFPSHDLLTRATRRQRRAKKGMRGQ